MIRTGACVGFQMGTEAHSTTGTAHPGKLLREELREPGKTTWCGGLRNEEVRKLGKVSRWGFLGERSIWIKAWSGTFARI